MDEQVIKRIPPHDNDAENAVIGSMLMDKDAIYTAGELLTKDDFYNAQYGIIFETIVDMNHDGIGIDPVTLRNRLKEKDVPPELMSTEFISGIINSVPISTNIKNYALIVHDKAMLRSMIKANETILQKCYMDKVPVEVVLDEAEKKIFDISQRSVGSEFEPIRKIALRTLSSMEKAAHNKGHITGLETGFRELDFKTAGLQKSDLILVAARPAMGKTAFVLNIAQYISLHSKSSVAIFSLEMGKEQLAKRLLSMSTNVDSQNIRTGELADDEWEKIVDGVMRLGKTNLHICDESGITLSEIRSKCRKLKIEKGLDLVIIDYLQLMSGGGGRKGESRQQEISDISRGLKILARELDIPVIALSQLSRAVESRPDKKPLLSDLRESGAIEQDADIVMFLYRDEYYNPESEDKGMADVIIAKQRSGPTGSIKLAWLANYTKFANLEIVKK